MKHEIDQRFLQHRNGEPFSRSYHFQLLKTIRMISPKAMLAMAK